MNTEATYMERVAVTREHIAIYRYRQYRPRLYGRRIGIVAWDGKNWPLRHARFRYATVAAQIIE